MEVRGIPDWNLVEGVTMRGGVERVVLMASSNYGTGCRRVTWSIFELGLIVHGRFVYISTGDYAGSGHGERKSMPETGLGSLGQGSWIRTWSGCYEKYQKY